MFIKVVRLYFLTPTIIHYLLYLNKKLKLWEPMTELKVSPNFAILLQSIGNWGVQWKNSGNRNVWFRLLIYHNYQIKNEQAWLKSQGRAKMNRAPAIKC